MTNSINDTLKRKEYGWFVFFIAALVASARLAGVIGAVGAALILSGLYKVIKNETFSIKKKIGLSSVLIVGGITVILLIAGLLGLGISKVVRPNDPSAQQILNATNTSPVNFVTATSSNQNILEEKAYKDSKFKFEIQAPKGWIVNTNPPDLTVQFDDPTPGQVALLIVGADKGIKQYTLRQFAAGAMQGFIGDDSGGPDKQVRIISQGDTTLNGYSAYVVEYTYVYTLPDGQKFPFHATSFYVKNDDTGYSIFLSTQEEIWTKFKDTLLKSASTFKYTN
jgi:hypothetical protein